MSFLTTFVIKPSTKQLANYSHLLEQALQLSQDYHTHRVTDDNLKTIGLALWQFLNRDTTFELSVFLRKTETSKTPLAIVIECQDNALFSLPWECLYHPKQGFLGKHINYTLSRRVRVNNKSAPSMGPLNILLWTALPEKMTHRGVRLDIEIEQQAVFTALKPFISAGWVHFYAPNDGRFTQFMELLSSQNWTIVILNGHGILKKEKAATSAFFMFEDETGDGEGELVSAHTLAKVFKGTNIQCVVVATCQSAQLLATPTNLVMPIVQTGIAHVIGMREPLIDRAGSVFVQTLCVALAEQKRVDVAVQEARRAMTQLLANDEIWRDIALGHRHSDPSVGQWCLPMLFSHDPTQALLNEDFCPQPRNPTPVGSKITLPKVFIGRRRELRTLEEGLRTGTIQRLFICGAGGLGKTALAGQLAITLAQQGYRVLVYQIGGKKAFIPTLAEVLELPQINCLEKLLKKLIEGHWLLWLDNLERIQHPCSGALTDSTIQNGLDILSQWIVPDLRILITSRIPYAAIDYHNYPLKYPCFNDFSRYLHYLGLPYQFPQILKIYQTLGGNFQGVQLLQSLPFCVDMPGLLKQLAMVRRYLRAYQNNECTNLSSADSI
jgi:hypothetical protein